MGTINTNLANETIARQTADSNLSTQLQSEMETRADQDANLNALINAGIREGGGVQFDTVPTQNSANGITSGGMYSTLRDSNIGFVDSMPDPLSNNLVKSGGVYQRVKNYLVNKAPKTKTKLEPSDYPGGANSVIYWGAIRSGFSGYQVYELSAVSYIRYVYANFVPINNSYNYFQNVLLKDNNGNNVLECSLYGEYVIAVPANYTIAVCSSNFDVCLVDEFYSDIDEIGKIEELTASAELQAEIEQLDSLMFLTNNLMADRGAGPYEHQNPIRKLTDEDYDLNSILNKFGTLVTGSGIYFKTTKAIENTVPESHLILEADFYGEDLSFSDWFKHIAYYKNGNLIKTYNAIGYRSVIIPYGYSVRISVRMDADVYLGPAGISTMKVTRKRKPIVWVGTSIPQNMTYPVISCWNNGMVCYNNSKGASRLCFDPAYRADASVTDINSFKTLTATVAEIRTAYAGSSLTPEQKELAEQESWENLIKPYINGEKDSCTMIVIDHGYNDSGNWVYGNAIWDMYYAIKGGETIDWESEDRTTFFGAFNYLRKRIHEINPFVRIVVGGYFYNDEGTNGDAICTCQQAIAEHYNYILLDTWNKSGISRIAVPNSANYISNFNTRYGTDYVSHPVDQAGNISYYQLYCPDYIHPHTDKSGHSRLLFDAIYTKFMANILAIGD